MVDYEVEKKPLPIAGTGPSLTLFVGYKPSNLTEGELLSLFPGSTAARIVHDRRGLPKGYGFVDFQSDKEAEEGLMCNGMKVQGYPLVVKSATPVPPEQAKSIPLYTIERGSNLPSSTLHLSNISFSTIEDTLRAAFKGCIDVRTFVKKSDRKIRYGFVDFASVEEAKAVFDTQEEIEVDGRVLYVNYALSPPRKPTDGVYDGTVKRGSNPPSSTLYVEGLSYSTTESKLKAAFEGCVGIRIIKEFGKSKGYGFVHYSNVEEAKAAFDKPDNIEVDGRVLFIDFITPKQPETEDVFTANFGKEENVPASMLFVGNIPWNSTEATLKTAFEGCIGVKIIREHRTGRSKGIGYVVYPSVDEAKAAYDKHSKREIVMEDRVLFVNFPRYGPKQGDFVFNGASQMEMINSPSPTLFVSNLPCSATGESLEVAFEGCVDAKVIMNPVTGEHKGYGFVEYASMEEAKAVVDRQESITMDGNTLRLNYSDRVPKETEEVSDSSASRPRMNATPNPTLFVSNLNYDTTESKLKAAFEGCVGVNIVRDSGKSKGFGFVDFASAEEAKAVFDNPEDIEVDDRVLFIDFKAPKPAEKVANRVVIRGDDPQFPTLFVGNLNSSTTESKLKEAFEGCIGVNIVRKAGISRGFGFVDFASVEEAKAAIDKPENVEVDGHVLSVEFKTPQPTEKGDGDIVDDENNPPTPTLYVSNLPYTTTGAALKEAFEGCVNANAIMDPVTGRSRGYGFVEYASVEEAKAVFDKQESITVDGSTVRVKYDCAKETSDVAVNRGIHPPSPKLFVNRLAYKTTVPKLKAAFEGCVDVEIIRERGRSKGYGFVTYASVEEAKAVFDSPENIELDGHILYIDFSKDKEVKGVSIKRGRNPPYPRLFVNNVSTSTTELTLKTAFEGCTDVHIVNEHGRDKAYAFVTYASMEEAKALFDKEENIVVDGEVLYINYSKPKEAKPIATIKTVRTQNNPPSSRLFVSNLYWHSTEPMLKAAFEGCTSVKIIKDNGRSKGYGFVDYASVEEAKAVFDQQEEIKVDGRVVYTNFISPKQREDVSTTAQTHPPCSTLYVSNLSSSTTESMLKATFDGCVKVKIVWKQGREKGFGFLEFASVEEAKAVLDKQEKIEVDGEVLFINYLARKDAPSQPIATTADAESTTDDLR